MLNPSHPCVSFALVICYLRDPKWIADYKRCPDKGRTRIRGFRDKMLVGPKALRDLWSNTIHLSHAFSCDINTFAHEACRVCESFDISRGLPRVISTFSITRLAEFWKCWYRMRRHVINVLSHFLWSQIWPGKQNLIKRWLWIPPKQN